NGIAATAGVKKQFLHRSPVQGEQRLVRAQNVKPGSTRDDLEILGERCAINAQFIDPCATLDGIVAVALVPEEGVVVIATRQNIGAGSADQCVRAEPAGNCIGTLATGESVHSIIAVENQ